MPHTQKQVDSDQSKPLLKKIPVTLLTGFLGAGKTTLLNYLLSHPEGEKLAVIVNEFGQVGIDGELIVKRDETMIELSNGCVCCTVRTDLIDTLTQLVKQKLGMESLPQQPFDRVIIETTGLADPVPLIQTFSLDEVISTCYALEQVVTVVDAKHFDQERKYLPLAEEQVAFADSVVLNKLDLVSEKEATAIEKTIITLNPLATLFRATEGRVSAREIFRTMGTDLILKRLQRLNNPKDDVHGHSHLSHIGAVVVTTDQPLKHYRVLEWISEMQKYCGPDIYRYKGIVWCEEWPGKRAVLQGVHMLSTLAPDRDWKEDETRETKIVLIGRSLDEQWIKQTFSTLTHEGL